jgi:hypothetical protein
MSEPSLVFPHTTDTPHDKVEKNDADADSSHGQQDEERLRECKFFAT